MSQYKNILDFQKILKSACISVKNTTYYVRDHFSYKNKMKAPGFCNEKVQHLKYFLLKKNNAKKQRDITPNIDFV